MARPSRRALPGFARGRRRWPRRCYPPPAGDV